MKRLDNHFMDDDRKPTIYWLARTNNELPSKNELSDVNRRLSFCSVMTDTIHSSKGKEADYVIISQLNDDMLDLPIDMPVNPILNALLPNLESYKHSEERRLFYVALTRAKKKVFLRSKKKLVKYKKY